MIRNLFNIDCRNYRNNMKFLIGTLFILIPSITAYLFPDGYEIIYDYRGTVEIYDSDVQHLSSQYEILSEIIIQNLGNGSDVQIRLDNVRYTMYVGEGIGNGEETQLPENRKKILQLPFILLNEESKYSLKVHKNDEPWSVQIKEIIVFILNVDQKFLNNVSIDETRTNSTIENYGNREGCRSTYVVKNKGKEYEVIKKTSLHSCHELSFETNFLAKYQCYSTSNKHYLKRHIIVTNNDGLIYIKNIHSYTLFSMHFNVFYANANQFLTMKSINKIKEHRESGDYVDVKSLSTNPENVEKYFGKIKTILEFIVAYIETLKIELKDAIDEQQENIFALVDYLKYLGKSDLLKIYYEILDTSKNVNRTREIFLLVLPIVGTKDAIVAIRHLILTKSVNEAYAISMLQNIPKLTSDEDLLLLDLDDLIKEGNGLSKRVRNVATLIFATTVKTFDKFLMGLSDSKFDFYATNISRKLIDSKDYKEQFLLVNALGNMQTGNIYTILYDIIKGRQPFQNLNIHLRSLAMLSCLQGLKLSLAEKKRMPADDVLMSLFLNKFEHMEIRLMALYALMEISQPDTWTMLFWHMKSEENDEIRGLFYSTLQTLSESTIECFRNRVGFAKQLIKLIPMYSIKKSDSKNELYEYVDSMRKNGYASNIVVLGNLNKYKFLTIVLKHSFAVQRTVFYLETFYLYLRLKDDYDKHINMDLGAIQQISSEDLSLELIIVKKDMIIYAEVFQPSDILKLLNVLQESLTNSNANLLKRFENYRWVEPLDFGFSAVEYFKASNIHNIKSKEFTMSSVDLAYKSVDNMEYGLKIYNPMLNTWHGMRRVLKVDVLFGIKFELTNNNINRIPNFDWTPIGNEDQSVGFKSIGHTEAYISGDDGERILHQSCKICKKAHTLNKNRKNLTIYEYDDENTGLLYQFKIFDCEEEDIIKHKEHFQQIIRDRMQKLTLKNIYLTVQNLWSYTTLSPGYGTCGLGFTVQPSENYPVTHLTFQMTSLEPMVMSLNIMVDKVNVKSWNFKYQKSTKQTDGHISIKKVSATSAQSETCFLFNRQMETEVETRQFVLKIIHGENCNINQEYGDVEQVKVSVIAKESQEQLKYPEIESRIYDECILNPEYQYAACVTKATALRENDINIDGKLDFLSEFSNNFFNTLNDFYGVHSYDSTELFKHPFIGNHIKFVYNLRKQDELDISIAGNFGAFRIKNVHLGHTKWPRLMEPWSSFDFENYLDLQDCEVRKDDLELPEELVSRNINESSNWILLLEDCNDHECNKIFVKRISNDRIGLRVKFGFEELLYEFKEKINMYRDDLPYKTNGERYSENNLMKFRFLHEGKTILVHLKKTSTVFGFDGVSVKISAEKQKFTGLCAQ